MLLLMNSHVIAGTRGCALLQACATAYMPPCIVLYGGLGGCKFAEELPKLRVEETQLQRELEMAAVQLSAARRCAFFDQFLVPQVLAWLPMCHAHLACAASSPERQRSLAYMPTPCCDFQAMTVRAH